MGVIKSHVSPGAGFTPAVISLGLTKAGKRQGAAESVTVSVADVVRRLSQWKESTVTSVKLCPPPHTWRKKFAQYLKDLHLDAFEFRPYSLRRGGATFWFRKHGSLDKILVQGRWQAQKTARIYLNEGLAVQAEMQTPRHPDVAVFRAQYLKAVKAPLPKFEHAQGRTGGHGKKVKREVEG